MPQKGQPPKKHGQELKNKERLLIKVILPGQGKERKVIAAGGRSIPFRVVDKSFRSSLNVRLKAIGALASASDIGVIPARVQLNPKAFAKSHRPDVLFSSGTCPIIGAGKLGDLFIKCSPEGVRRLQGVIEKNHSGRVIKDISTLVTIEPIDANYRLHGHSSSEIVSMSPKLDDKYVVKVKLFDFGSDVQGGIVEKFFRECARHKIEVRAGGYSPESYCYQAFCGKSEQVQVLASYAAVKSVADMPLLRSIGPAGVKGSALEQLLPPPDNRAQGYPIVVVVDSGVETHKTGLQDWVVGRDSHVPPEYADKEHGTFIAGLLCWADTLNPDLAGVDSYPCKVFDLQVIPNDGSLTETQLLEDLAKALNEHANEFKVWNLSLNCPNVKCSLDEFSSLAVELDNLQEKYAVSFVISAGNYSTKPLLSYPRNPSESVAGRILSPADSVLGITVGSISHKAYQNCDPGEGEPTPYSRNGPGPNHIIKPDFVHYGGACTCAVDRKDGVISVSSKGAEVVPGLGTSYAAPMVSRLLANVYHQVTPAPSPLLARAILTHHACHPRKRVRGTSGEENFLGFGIPRGLDEMLHCPPWASTLIFEDELRNGFFMEWDDFPYPSSLSRGGRYYGDIAMTIAFAPKRGEKWGTEYCQTHIDAKFGAYYKTKNRKTGEFSEPKFVGLVPPEHSDTSGMYESFQVKNLRKWAPVRTYFGSLGEKGFKADRWRLKVQLLCRHNVQYDPAFKPQKFALILTIMDPHKKAPIYNEMAVALRTRYQMENLDVRTQISVQGQT